MIIDNIKNASKYYSVHPQFRAVFEGLKKLDENSDCIRYDLDGDNAFYSLSSYTNKPVSECKFEAHRIYADIQYVISGHEHIDVTDAAKLTVTEDFKDGGDIAFYKDCGDFSTADLQPGDFVILFPEEAHRPLVAPNGVGIKTVKAVAKIKIG